MREQLRSLTNKDFNDIDVKIKNRWKDISPLLYFANWTDSEDFIVSIENPVFSVVGEDQLPVESDCGVSGTKLKSLTMKAKTKISNALLNNTDAERYISNAFAIATQQAIEFGLFYGDSRDKTIPTITSTGTVISLPSNTNVTLTNLVDMYKALDPVCLDGAHWKVSKDVRDIILLSKIEETSAEFRYWLSSRLYFMGLPVYVDENFSDEKGIIAALVNPNSIFLKCNLFDEEATIKLQETGAEQYQTTFLSVFDVCGVVDKADSAIILKVEVPAPTKTTKTRKAK